MGRKKPSSKYNSLDFTKTRPDKSQPTISQSFNKAKEFNDKMDDSDDDVEIINSARSVRVERRHKALALEKEEQENEANLRQQEEADLQRAIELSRMEACGSGSQEWYTNDVVPRQSQSKTQMNMEEQDEDILLDQEDESSNEDKKSVKSLSRMEARGSGSQEWYTNDVAPRQSRSKTQVNMEEQDEDDLLGQEDGSSNEDKKSVKSEILLDSDNEEELPKKRESEVEMGFNSSRVSDGSSASVTFPGNHLQRRPARKEEQTVEVLEDVGEDFEEDIAEVGVDEAGSGLEEFNLSQDLFSPGRRITEQEKPAEEKDLKNKRKQEDSDEDFVPADEDEDDEEDIKSRKISRLTLRKRKREEDEASAPSKTLKVTRNLSPEDYEGETQPMSSDSQKEEDAKQEIENLVNGPFSLVQSEQLEERLHDNRMQTEASRPFYAPSVAEPQDYSVVILQMIECCLKQIRQRRFVSPDDRCWGNPVRPGPHVAKYLILRRRGVRIPPSDKDSDDETTEGEVSEICGKKAKKDAQVCEDSDEDFEPIKMSARRQTEDSHRAIKRPRSEPRESEKVSSHSIVCPKPIRRHPNPSSFQKFSQGSADESAFQERHNTTPDRQRPPTPSVRTFDFNGSQSPNFHGPSSRLPSGLQQSDISEPPLSSKRSTTPVRKLRRSSSNPEFHSPNKEDTSSFMTDIAPWRDEHKAGPSKQVAQVRPRNSSPWLSKASFKNSNSQPNSQPQLEGGFIREEDTSQRMHEALDRPSTSEDGLKTTNPPSPLVPSPPKIVPSVNVGIECPLCGQKYPISTIEAHASECDGSIPLDDEIDISGPVTEEPVRSSVNDNEVHQPAKIPNSPQNVKNDESMDHIDAAILQMVENKEINLIPSRNPQSKNSRSLKNQFEDVFDEDDHSSRLRGSKKNTKEDFLEKCFLCKEMIPKDDYLNHLNGHKELNSGSKLSRDSSEDPPDEDNGDPIVSSTPHMAEERSTTSRDAVSNGSSEEHKYLRAMYGRKTKNNIEDDDEEEEEEEEDILDWTQPGMVPGDSDSPIKAFQSIKESRSIVDFKNQFKEASSVRSRADVRGRGRGRGRGTKRKRGKGKRGRGRRKAATLT